MTDMAINFASYWDLIVKLVGLPILLLAIIYTWFRAGSLHFLRDKIWLISSLKRKFSDNQLNRQWDEIRDIEMLRFKMGLPFSYKEELDDLIKYLKTKGISIYEIISLSNHFDLKNRKFNDVSYKKWSNLFWTGSILLLFTGYSLFSLSISDTVWLRIKKTGTSILYNGEEIKIENISITKDTCANNTPMSISSSDKVTVCQLLNEGSPLYKDILKKQKFTLILFGFLLFSTGIFFMRKGQEYDKTLKLSKRLAIKIESNSIQ